MSAWLVSIRQLRNVILDKAKTLRGLSNHEILHCLAPQNELPFFPGYCKSVVISINIIAV